MTGTRKTKPCVACGQAGLREGILGWGGEKKGLKLQRTVEDDGASFQRWEG